MSDGSSAFPVHGDGSDEVFDSSPWPQGSEGESPPKKIPRTLAPNLTRRSHRKSRGGCFNCKSRKIKCQETRPSCENCMVKEIECRYPSQGDQKITRRPVDTSRSDTALAKTVEPRLPPSLAPPTSFSMDDMRCFHHFLTVAYPHLPLGNDSVWVQDIPHFAQQHEYLMHALLALGASHLTRVSSQSDYSTIAIVHQGQAIKGLNEALAKGKRDYGESDAMLASCYALAFQASHMGDGMTDFITMARGCALVTDQIRRDQSQTAFNLERDNHFRVMEPRLDQMPTLDPSLIMPATISLEALRPLLRRSMDLHLHDALLLVLLGLRESSKAAYVNFTRVYNTCFDMDHDQFNVFIDINNIPSQLLLAHMIAIHLLMVPLTVHEWPHRACPSKVQVLLGMVEWGEKIFQRTPSNMSVYLEWPNAILNAVRKEIEALNAGTHRSLQLRILNSMIGV